MHCGKYKKHYVTSKQLAIQNQNVYRPLLSFTTYEYSFHLLQVLIKLINKIDGSIHPLTYECSPFFFFHVVNAFERDDTVIIDVMAYKDAEVHFLES